MKSSAYFFLILFGVVSFFSYPGMAREDSGTLQSNLEDFFGIYILNKDKRSAMDRVIVTGNDQTGYTAEISYWRSLQSRDPAEELCNSYRWLLTGRGKYGKGAIEAFNQYPSLSQIQLSFFDVETDTKIGKKRAEILPTSRMIPYLKIGVERRSLLAKNPNPKELRERMSKGNCAEVGNSFLVIRRFNENYLRQAR